MPWIIVGLYFICLFVIFIYALLQFSLTWAYVRNKRKQIKCAEKSFTDLPLVTIQLPLYNEKYVAERLIESIAKINYPQEKLQIQVLDDSTDETTAILAAKIAELGEAAHHIKLIRRPQRVGFKAGALAYGLKHATGDFVAIFDADFVPDPNFLYATLPYFSDENVGVVQTRWEHINRNTSLLTKLQAFALDAHFSIEQVGRSNGKHFINFNGTAGVWRKTTIEDAGGWHHDTLTEDLDLSYRAQLKGWKFIYKEDVLSPAELPVAISALKNQQYRWTKGGAENFRKMAGKLLFGKKIRLSDRIHGLGHLFNSSVYFFVFTAAILTVPLILAAHANPTISHVISWMALFFSSTLLLMLFYWFSFREKSRYKWMKAPLFFLRFFQFLTVSLGLSFYNSQGIVLAYAGKKTAFIRTPKFNQTEKNTAWKKNAYLYEKLGATALIEGVLALYFAMGIVISAYFEYYGMIPFQAMLMIGFAVIFIYTLKEKSHQ